MSPTAIGVALLGVFGVLYFLGRMPTVTALSGFFGVVLTGTTGWLGRTLADVATWVQVHVVGRLTADIAGSSLAFLATLIIGVIFVHDLHPRHTTGRRTAWLGIALGAIIVAGATGIPALNDLRQQIVSGVSSL
jgi:hypothetical protein